MSFFFRYYLWLLLMKGIWDGIRERKSGRRGRGRESWGSEVWERGRGEEVVGRGEEVGREERGSGEEVGVGEGRERKSGEKAGERGAVRGSRGEGDGREARKSGRGGRGEEVGVVIRNYALYEINNY